MKNGQFRDIVKAKKSLLVIRHSPGYSQVGTKNIKTYDRTRCWKSLYAKQRNQTKQYGCFEICQFRPCSVFFMSWRLNPLADDFGVYAITVTTSAFHSRICVRLYVILIWRHQGNGWINTDVRYPSICLISEIYKGRSFSFHDTDSSK